MRTLTLAPLSIGLSRRIEASSGAAQASPRMLLDTSGAPAQRRMTRPGLRQSQAGADTVQSVEAALLQLQDVFFFSCADYPSDEELQQRIRTHCRKIESKLLPEQMRAWRSGRDCLLARLGSRLHLD